MLNVELAAEAWCAAKCESDYYYEEAEDEECRVHCTDGLPTVEPYLTIPAKCLHCAPETVSEVEPESHEPYDVENYINRVGEGVLDVGKTVSRIVRNVETYKLSKHHVVPEVPEVEQEAEQYDDAKNEHVL